MPFQTCIYSVRVALNFSIDLHLHLSLCLEDGVFLLVWDNAGDEVLVRVALCLKERFPESSYRTGGDEFLISDCICDERTFRNQVEEIRTSLAREGISISSGISIRESNADFKEQYIRADREMYRCKMASRQGR